MFKWYQRWKKRKQREHYERGFDWAAGVILREELSCGDVRTIADDPFNRMLDGDLHHFDVGAIDAANKIEDLRRG